MPITSVAALTAPDAERLEGRDVELFDVQIAEVRGDTAFYVTDTTPRAPGATDQPMNGAPGATTPGAAPANPQQPGQPGTAAQQRVLVMYDTGILGLDMTADDDVIRVGQRVNVFGTVRMRDTAAPRTQPAPMETDAVEQPATGQQPPAQTTPAPGMDRVYVDADRVERSDATAPRTTQPGQTGDAY